MPSAVFYVFQELNCVLFDMERQSGSGYLADAAVEEEHNPEELKKEDDHGIPQGGEACFQARAQAHIEIAEECYQRKTEENIAHPHYLVGAKFPVPPVVSPQLLRENSPGHGERGGERKGRRKPGLQEEKHAQQASQNVKEGGHGLNRHHFYPGPAGGIHDFFRFTMEGKMENGKNLLAQRSQFTQRFTITAPKAYAGEPSHTFANYIGS